MVAQAVNLLGFVLNGSVFFVFCFKNWFKHANRSDASFNISPTFDFFECVMYESEKDKKN